MFDTIELKIDFVAARICSYDQASDVPAWLFCAASDLLSIQVRLDTFCTYGG